MDTSSLVVPRIYKNGGEPVSRDAKRDRAGVRPGAYARLTVSRRRAAGSRVA
jgi:hypothetical protein